MISGASVSARPTSAGSDTAVTIDEVEKRFGGVHALRGLSARIGYGRLTGLVGPDGAGKTTLMRILTGLLVPDAGRATVAGFDVVRDNDAVHVATGYMPQRFGLYEDLSVMENMRLYARLRGMDADRIARLVLTEIRKTPQLAECTQQSFAGALLTASALGLESAPELRHLCGRDDQQVHCVRGLRRFHARPSRCACRPVRPDRRVGR